MSDMTKVDILRANAASISELAHPPPGIANSLHMAADEIERLRALVIQYRSDLLHPVTDSGSLERRLAAIDAALSGSATQEGGE